MRILYPLRTHQRIKLPMSVQLSKLDRDRRDNLINHNNAIHSLYNEYNQKLAGLKRWSGNQLVI